MRSRRGRIVGFIVLFLIWVVALSAVSIWVRTLVAPWLGEPITTLIRALGLFGILAVLNRALPRPDVGPGRDLEPQPVALPQPVQARRALRDMRVVVAFCCLLVIFCVWAWGDAVAHLPDPHQGPLWFVTARGALFLGLSTVGLVLATGYLLLLRRAVPRVTAGAAPRHRGRVARTGTWRTVVDVAGGGHLGLPGSQLSSWNLRPGDEVVVDGDLRRLHPVALTTPEGTGWVAVSRFDPLRASGAKQ